MVKVTAPVLSIDSKAFLKRFCTTFRSWAWSQRTSGRSSAGESSRMTAMSARLMRLGHKVLRRVLKLRVSRVEGPSRVKQLSS